MKITVLVENTISKSIEESLAEKLKAEHGLSLFIETENHKILFDIIVPQYLHYKRDNI